MDTNNEYDLIIVGAGMVGLTLANALASTNLNIAIIDSKPIQPNWDATQPSLRVSAINRASENIFKNLDLWQGVENRRLSLYRNMQVWDASGNGEIHFDCANLGETNLGHIIENQVIIDSLIEKLKTYKNIIYYAPETLTELHEDDNTIELVTESGRHITTKLLVGADGANSWVRTNANFLLTKKDYNHHALIANINTQHSHQLTAWQRFLPNGVLALLPLQNRNTCSIVWSTQPQHADELMQYDDEAFNQRLTSAFENKLGELTVQSKRASFPLSMRHTKDYIKHRIALIGDAAHTIHPLAGQGVNLGLQDAACLAEVIQHGLSKQIDIGEYTLLRRYQRWRKGHNTSMILAMAGFKQLFAAKATPIVKVRNLGINLANRLPPLQYQFAKQALGMHNDLPKLARHVEVH